MELSFKISLQKWTPTVSMWKLKVANTKKIGMLSNRRVIEVVCLFNTWNVSHCYYQNIRTLFWKLSVYVVCKKLFTLFMCYFNFDLWLWHTSNKQCILINCVECDRKKVSEIKHAMGQWPIIQYVSTIWPRFFLQLVIYAKITVQPPNFLSRHCQLIGLISIL